jgi:DNA adenine methylase
MIDNTALARQKKRLVRLSERRIKRTTVLVHEDNIDALNFLRPHLVAPECADALSHLTRGTASALKVGNNLANVKQLSPFRYPGGKTWLVPEVRRWISTLGYRPSVFIEPFAGGGSIGLTVAVENLADQVILVELDPDVSAVWKVIFGKRAEDVDWLTTQIACASLSDDFVKEVIFSKPTSLKERAFRTIIKNRCQRGGILAPGAGLVKSGENGRGLLSRWYPETLVDRIELLRSVRARVQFVEGHAFDMISKHSDDPSVAWFVDPPYSLGGKKAGQRLYLHCDIDHARLFHMMASARGKFLMTYDDTTEVLDYAHAYDLTIKRLPMRSTHNKVVNEIVITKI